METNGDTLAGRSERPLAGGRHSLAGGRHSLAGGRRPHGNGPDWRLVPFDVECPRCGTGLNGRSEPRCPQCDLEFVWDDLVPLDHLNCLNCGYHLLGLTEKRCPECGTRFEWDDVLNANRLARKPHFEYRWRDRPIRSFVWTFFAALRPRRFWSGVEMRDPPRVRPLIVMAVLLTVAIVVSDIVLEPIADWVYFMSRGAARGLSSSGVTGHLAWIVRRINRYAISTETVYFVAALFFWAAASLGALLIFQKSMRKYKIRTVHVVRIWACSVFPSPALAPAILRTAYCLSFTLLPGRSVSGFDSYLGAVFLGYICWSIRCGYKYYAHMPRGLLAAVGSQIVAILAALVFLSVISPSIAAEVIEAIISAVYRW
ncbi:MAG: hypothetical protein IID36_11195 [Planctomycetes bacterium]|nr:hypothetical protein [Planctomycetota bacterium]